MPDATVGEPPFDAAVRRQVLALIRNRLETRNHPLAVGGEAVVQFLREAGQLLEEVEPDVPGLDGTTHPAESLRSFHVAFETLLCLVQQALPAPQPGEQALPRGIESMRASVVRGLEADIAAQDRSSLAASDALHQDELRRIARELHDVAAHSVGVALQDLELHEFYADRDPQQARRHLGSARAELRGALDVIRYVTWDVRREPLVGAGGLGQALSAYLESRVPPGTRTTLSVTHAGDLPDEVNSELYLVIREAVRNAVRHAQATAVAVSVLVTSEEVRATVDDDGKGFDPDRLPVRGAGYGLSSMRDRVRLLGGTLDVTSAPGEGTTISLCIARGGLDP
jgi:signal transduction histidine kinase